MDHDLSDDQKAEFYKSHRERSATSFKKKHRVQFDREFTDLTAADPSMSVLEVGCGTGLFLRYLESRGYRDIVGIDTDENLADALAVLERSEIYFDDVIAVLDNQLKDRKFDRIVVLDVAEHIKLPVLIDLMKLFAAHITDDGQLLLRTPNVESPWGLKMFFGSFDHVTPLGPGRMVELAALTGWSCEGVFPQEPTRLLRRLKERLLNGVLAAMLSYHPDVWTANLLAVFKKIPAAGADGGNT